MFNVKLETIFVVVCNILIFKTLSKYEVTSFMEILTKIQTRFNSDSKFKKFSKTKFVFYFTKNTAHFMVSFIGDM